MKLDFIALGKLSISKANMRYTKMTSDAFTLSPVGVQPDSWFDKQPYLLD